MKTSLSCERHEACSELEMSDVQRPRVRVTVTPQVVQVRRLDGCAQVSREWKEIVPMYRVGILLPHQHVVSKCVGQPEYRVWEGQPNLNKVPFVAIHRGLSQDID
jgi:hypothetical protein